MAECLLADRSTFLSDVSAGASGSLSERGTLTSRFLLHLPIMKEDDDLGSSVSEHLPMLERRVCSEDEDGDLVVHRRKQQEQHNDVVLLIDHVMSTVLEDVGQQVWNGAFLMADYVIHNRKIFEGATVLELGAGVGLVSIVASIWAKLVYCTDTGIRLLDICQHNIEQNLLLFDSSGEVCVEDLNWANPFHPSGSAPYVWTAEDLERLKSVDHILAADVVYDDSLTDMLFSCLVLLHTKFKIQPTIIIAMERRVVFTLEDLAPVCPAHDYFMQCLKKEYSTGTGDESKLMFEAKRFSTGDLPQHLDFERTNEMELWELHAK